MVEAGDVWESEVPVTQSAGNVSTSSLNFQKWIIKSNEEPVYPITLHARELRQVGL